MIELKSEKRIPHNYFNQKVMNWILENQNDLDFNVVSNTSGFCNSCEIDSRYERGNTVFYRMDEERESKYFDYICMIDSDYLLKVIPNLNEEEKEELEDIAQVWVYYCPDCKEWALDGANI